MGALIFTRLKSGANLMFHGNYQRTKMIMVRISQNLTLDQLAAMCHGSTSFVSKIENNKDVLST